VIVDPAHDADLFEIRRRKMVERQILPRGVRDALLLEAMREIPREIFVDEALRGQAYADNALPIGYGQTISQPYIVARMTEMLKVSRTDTVLEVGTGTGYQTALLARLAGRVLTLERIAELAAKAVANLGWLGFDNVEVLVADGSVGMPERSPFDRILVAAGAPAVPPSLIAQLKVGGRLVIPVGDQRSQVLTLVVRADGGHVEERDEACTFVRLIGEEGWPEAPETP
jgi:protein-L-isoaspartate(D-aspartate) O-methyltransferase